MDGNINIDYNVDAAWQRYCDLMGRLGELQYDLEHIDIVQMQTSMATWTIGLVITVLLGVIIVMGGAAISESFGTVRTYGSHDGYIEWTRKSWAVFIVIMAMYVAVALLIIDAVTDYQVMMDGHRIEKSIDAVQMEIDALERTWGFGGSE